MTGIGKWEWDMFMFILFLCFGLAVNVKTWTFKNTLEMVIDRSILNLNT